jgi:uncharacterized membrane protein
MFATLRGQVHEACLVLSKATSIVYGRSVVARSEDVAVPVPGPNEVAGRFAVHVTGVGHAMYAAAVAGLGVLLLSSAFIYVWAPIPRWIPGRAVLACAAGVLMLAVAAGLLLRKTVVLCSAVLALVFLGWLLLLQVPQLIATPSEELLWSGGAQLMTVVAGGWVLFASLGAPTERSGRWMRGDLGVHRARSLFAVALPVFGIHHFFHAAEAAAAIPAWLPFPLGWGYLTGVAHIIAGVAILVGIMPRLAATLEAIMIGVFVLLIHVPGMLAAPADPLQWTMFLVAAAIGSAASIVARSYAGDRGQPR